MLCELPRDILWLILKTHMTDVLSKGVELHKETFSSVRTRLGREYYERTCAAKNSLSQYYLVDYLYPLRLVCKKINTILCEKVKVNAGSAKWWGMKVMP